MYLKRLEIQGFKSFRERTILDFLPTEQGRFSITAIVGPNGSGKSNITDAIRWVMGETSMKTIRSKKSEDVIFNGSEAKGALSAAEVTMVLDNSDNRVGIETEEVSITRRLYRSGESEYLINNNLARLLDVQLLIAKAQFAEHSYSIVSQGMIDRLLTVTPAERKDFFDEASGIKELQIKRHQAELKLKRTQENITQAQVIVQEVEPRLKILARQVKKLEERAEVEEELREVQEVYYFTIYSKNKQEIDTLESSAKMSEDRYRILFSELESIQTELAELSRVSSRQEIFDTLQNEYQQAVREKNNYERELAILEGQMHTEYSKTGKQNIGWLEGKISESKKNQQQFVQELTRLETELKRLSGVVLQYKKQLEELEITKNQATLRISRLQNELLKGQSEQHYRDFSGLTALKAVLDHKRDFGEVYGVVAELGEVEERYRLALEVAAGQHLTSLVVENDEVARRAIEYLRKERLGIATFLPLNKIQGRTLSVVEEQIITQGGVVGLALQLVNFDKKIETIFSFLFGTTVVVENLQSAQSLGIGRVRMVTLSGDLIEKNGVLRGGFRQVRRGFGFSSKLNLSSEDRLENYRRDILNEQDIVKELTAKEGKCKDELLKFQVEIETLHSKVSLLEQQKQQVDTELVSLEREYNMIQGNPEEYSVALQKLATEKDGLIKRINTLVEVVEKAQKRIEQFNVEEEKKKQRVFSLQETMQRKQQEVNAVLTERNDYKIALAKLETKQEDLAQEVYNDMNSSLASLVERVNRIVELDKLEELVGQIQKLKYKLSLIGGIDQDVIKEHGETKERFDFISGQLKDLEKALNDLTSLISDLDNLMKKKREAAFKKIRKEFNRYFQILFEGGNAQLEEVYGEPTSDEDDMYEDENAQFKNEGNMQEQKKKSKEKVLTGIEVIANPPGKKIRYLNALSGGERTLTSIALICAILHNNPSPFVVLDEVEAALDEANTQRFVRIMEELSKQSQFIIVTHNRVTMHAADALYGVVMGREGVSKLCSVKMEDIKQVGDEVSIDKTVVV